MSEILLQENILTKLIPQKITKKYNQELKDRQPKLSIENAIRLDKKGEEVVELEEYNKYKNELNDGYARKLFRDILKEAIDKNASDIHIEPFEEYLTIRLRVDGELSKIKNFSMEIYPYLSSIIKLDAGMDITEKRLPQDGRFDIMIDDTYLVDIRASCISTVYSEKIVLRILKRDSFLKNKKELGFSNKAVSKINNIINNKSGILLITGSTGSGKTTTLYSILNDLRNISKNIMTIEDPVEYKMEGINQIQVNSKLGLSFDVGLRSILRQDPDIIMVGEIRDIETAKTAIRAAMTGHLVISTMHTNDAISSISRLLDMQIQPYLINSSLIGIISQKLVRKVCPKCSRDIIINDSIEGHINTKIAVGCDWCSDKGYIGRTAIYEILEVNNEIRKCIQQMKNYNEIKEVAMKSGMITFEQSSKQLIKERITTLEECVAIEKVE